jgi:hypothetical protein
VIRVVAVHTSERWSEDVSEDVARELQRRCHLQLTHAAQDTRQFSLRLV